VTAHAERTGVAAGDDSRGPARHFAATCFFAGALLAGVNPVAIRFSNRELDPLWGASLRFGIAGAILIALMLAMRLRPPRGRALVGTLLYGTLTFGIAFSLGYYAFVRVHAGLAQTILAIVPLATLLLAVLQRQERLRIAAVVGAVLALTGIALMARTPLREGLPALSLVALLANAFLVAEATVLVRRFPPVHPVTMNAIGMTVGALIQLVAATLVGERIVLPKQPSTWLALAYMVVLGSVLVYILYIVVLEHWSASRAAYSFVLMPVVAIALSVWLDGEPLRLTLVGGGLLILAGIYIGALRR
jgi:drug/metabolite transporter (DMT)-like permease